MGKQILITGATDGIGFETAKSLASQGHDLLLHGRNPEKLAAASEMLLKSEEAGHIESFRADLSQLSEVRQLCTDIAVKHPRLDVIINNAGVFDTPEPLTEDGFDVRFMVNTIAPYLLSKTLLPLLDTDGRIINLSSAAQMPVDLKALQGNRVALPAHAAYAQSKLALTMWTGALASSLGDKAVVIVAVNPASMLGSKMVKQAFGVDGADLQIGADILYRAALSEEFATASGKYFDNDIGRFSSPHPDALDSQKCQQLTHILEAIITNNN
ncbi:MAG: SDR family NAD(P)-dependent oxidoreductase [Desulfobulbaceae bacterium]|nr:MAG: SDR family NAD(P)-dependent oxidoreductase [Desulfobulbaceae bacterium]